MAEGRATFYFDVNSPYAYLAAMRIGDLIPGAVWRPIALAMLFREIGKVPWSLKPGREEGMAECERRAAERGLPPVTWPDGWPAERRSLADLDNTLAAAPAAGLDPDELRERIGEQAVKDRLREYTDEAVGLGAVGVPTVAVGGELFWGDDRLEEAAAAARG